MNMNEFMTHQILLSLWRSCWEVVRVRYLCVERLALLTVGNSCWVIAFLNEVYQLSWGHPSST